VALKPPDLFEQGAEATEISLSGSPRFNPVESLPIARIFYRGFRDDTDKKLFLFRSVRSVGGSVPLGCGRPGEVRWATGAAEGGLI
jgi:hypothetical protein